MSSYVPRVNDVLDIFNVNVQPIDAPRNLSNRSKFSILSDKVCRITEITSSSAECNLKMYKRLNFHTVYGTSDTSGDDIEKNALYVMMFTNATATYPSPLNFSIMHRLRYIDN